MSELERDFSEPTAKRFRPDLLDMWTAVSTTSVNPGNPSAWLKQLKSLPLEDLMRWWRRRPLVEIQRLRDERQGEKNRPREINELFGVRP